MSVTTKELKEYAKKWGYVVGKGSGDEKWVIGQEVDGVFRTIDSCGSVDDAATAIFNHLSDYRWVSYQQEYAAEKAAKAIHLEPPR